MKAILVTEIEGILLFLNEQGLATDRIELGRTFRDWTDAWWHACQINVDPGWSKFGIRWHPTYVLHNGDIVAWRNATQDSTNRVKPELARQNGPGRAPK